VFSRALLAFLALPGFFAGIVPWVVASLDPWRQSGWAIGDIILGFGLLVLLWCVRDFYISGKGTLAPWEPPKRLVVVGLYRFTRNPMYIGILLLVGGWSALAGSLLVACYLIFLAVAFHLRVVFHEEPLLSTQFPAEWQAYAAGVPRWIPRLTPWHDGRSHP
jgi:protein-S-isoprenylcysteine O-methyltransferase Ste14